MIPADAEAILSGRKPDGNEFAFAGSIAENKVTVDCNVQMTAVAGSVIYKLLILSGGTTVGTAYFVLDVAAAPESLEAVSSETTLPAYGEILKRIAEMGGGCGGGSVTVDDALADTSENPVQNKVVKAALDGKADTSALDNKVDKVSGKGLSTNDYTTEEKNKLAGIEAGAQKNPDLSVYALSANVHSIPAGGTAGQFLVKSSGTDYDAAWVTLQAWQGGSY